MFLVVLTLGWLLWACSSNGNGDGAPDAMANPDAVDDCHDSDGDRISDTHEGPAGTDTDMDGTPDVMDDDADGDGRLDVDEAGDSDPCTPPADADEDDIPNFRDTDSDGNGILDENETDADDDLDTIPNVYDIDDDNDGIDDVNEVGDDPTMPIDTDMDGTPDIQDTDADNDGIPDAIEGFLDWDGDGKPASADTDADGDGIPDAIEVGDDPLNPVDADSDGTPDFGDSDSDNDGLSDGQEDLNLDGNFDPGESDPTVEDTDNDGYPDVVEWAAGTNPDDVNDGLSPDDFFFLLPYEGDPQQDDLDFSTDINKADVFFEIDTTGSMGDEIATLRDSLQTVIVPGLDAIIDDVAMGVSSFRDFPITGFGDVADLPFELTQRITNDISAVQAGIDALVADGGADFAESGMEALYQAVTGEGVAWYSGAVGEVPKFIAYDGYDPSLGHGLLGGAGFRAGALPIVIHATDAPFHEGTDYNGELEPHSRDQAVAAARAMGARFIGLLQQGEPKGPLKAIARETGALVSPTAWGPFETQCHTGPSGMLEPPELDGQCPLVFSMSFGGGGAGEQVVEAIDRLVSFAAIDISGIPVADPDQLPGVDTSGFITAITPVAPAPPGSVINGDVFENVLPGNPVKFTVSAENRIVPGRRAAQFFRVTIRVRGSAVTVLDERDVFVVVPAATFIP